MNLKRRLIIANTLTVILPVLITVLTSLGYIFVVGKIADTEQSFYNTEKLTALTFELVGSQQGLLRETPGLVEEPSFQNRLKQQLAGMNGEVVILKQDEIVFSTNDLTKIDVAKLLEKQGRILSERIKVNDTMYNVQSIELKDYGRGEKIFFLVPVTSESFNLSSFYIFNGIIFVLSFVTANLILSFHFSQRIVSPLNNLQQAAAKIALGNLDEEIVEEGDQEIRELCRDMELMRLKLKSSVHTQFKYEDNRKMLISSISHDLKTPVTSIKGYVEGILDGVAATPEKKEKYLRTIYRKAQQIDIMIDDLLLYAKLDMNQIPFNLELTDIAEFLSDGLQESEPEMARDHIQFQWHNQLSGKWEIPLDRERMMRVIMNILDNSRKYMNKEKGRIEVTLRETLTSIIIEIQDNGAGIPEEELSQIFERFYRSDAARSEIKGSGLGLAIARQIIEGHEGRIWAISHKNQGTSILISLPKGKGRVSDELKDVRRGVEE